MAPKDPSAKPFSAPILSQEEPKANRIALGVDAHLKSYQAARKIDNGAVGVAQSFGSKEALLLYAQKQREQAKEVVVLYEAGPLGYTLYRELQAMGIDWLVCAPCSGEQKRKRRKNNTIDARSLTSDLSNYLNGNEQALQLVRIPTEAQEQARIESRQQDALVQERKRIGRPVYECDPCPANRSQYAGGYHRE